MNELVRAIQNFGDRCYSGAVCVGDLLRLDVPIPAECTGMAIPIEGELASAFEMLRRKMLSGHEHSSSARQMLNRLLYRLELGVAYRYLGPDYFNGIVK